MQKYGDAFSRSSSIYIEMILINTVGRHYVSHISLDDVRLFFGFKHSNLTQNCKVHSNGYNHIELFHFERYIVRYMVGNYILQLHPCVAISLIF